MCLNQEFKMQEKIACLQLHMRDGQLHRQDRIRCIGEGKAFRAKYI